MIDKTGTNILKTAQSYVTLKKTAAYKGGQWSGACPICKAGKDRFNVFEGDQSFWCRKCGNGGDVIKLVELVENLDFKGACASLGIALDGTPNQPRAERPRRKPTAPSIPHLRTDYAAFRDDWQDLANRFINYAVDQLWSDAGAMAYLKNVRRLTDGVIMASSLGFNPKPINMAWGETDVWLPRGIVIPWVSEGVNIWRIRFRALDDQYQHYSVKRRGDAAEIKYPQVRGSANGLYWCGRSSDITEADTIILTEGEFDALSVHSHAAGAMLYGYRAVATGGVTQARVSRWVDLLSKAGRVLLAFDAGESAGAMASFWWSSVLPNAERLAPLDHDINEMATNGRDFYEWLGLRDEPEEQAEMFPVSKHQYREA